MENIEFLNQKYSLRFENKRKINSEIKHMVGEYYSRWRLTAQAAACGISVSSLIDTGNIDIESADPQIIEAFNLAYPNIPFESLATASPEQLAGYVNAWKGKLFEVQVRDQLNAGDSVGGIRLDSGQHATLAESATQPGWDLQILDKNNEVVDEIQLKATESISYVCDALEQYPNYHVLATSDVEHYSDQITKLSTAGISEDDLQNAVEEPFSEIGNDDVWDSLLPALPFLLIATRQGYAVFSKEKEWDEALKIVVKDSAKSAIAVGGGYAIATVANEIAGDLATDLVGDVFTDIAFGALLPFGAGFLIRKGFDLLSNPKPKYYTHNLSDISLIKTAPVAPKLNEKIIRDWIMPRALLIQRTIGKQYLLPTVIR